MASSNQDTAPIEPRKETLKTESKVTGTAADTKSDDGNAGLKSVVHKPKLAIAQLDGDKADSLVEEDEDPTYSDDEDPPDFEGRVDRISYST
ncbi:hypothetical protein EST38_g9193 [Candolleomyces aberdarensis]|uniref:Uncharacterized protein n=1 Tax=Candolleomyces aberdarensis TaxID=2316362 RepID=A0A4Q2DAJ8_9AGAR|nr:hypothetical protein EST38_g9193 [Candolleomyces aberdarensis]